MLQSARSTCNSGVKTMICNDAFIITVFCVSENPALLRTKSRHQESNRVGCCRPALHIVSRSLSQSKPPAAKQQRHATSQQLAYCLGASGACKTYDDHSLQAWCVNQVQLTLRYTTVTCMLHGSHKLQHWTEWAWHTCHLIQHDSQAASRICQATSRLALPKLPSQLLQANETWQC